jgi:hypothetical protein
MRDPALDRIRHRTIVETTSADLLVVLKSGTGSTNRRSGFVSLETIL